MPSTSWRERGRRVAFILAAVLGGCSTGGPLPVDEPVSWHLRGGRLPNPAPVQLAPVAAVPRTTLEPIRASLVEVDVFQGLLVRAGVPASLLPKDGRQLTPEQAAALLTALMGMEPPLRDFGPWRMAAHLLVGVVRDMQPVPRGQLHARMRRYADVLVLRPDGYLVRAPTGEAVQYAGEVELTGDALRAEGFEVGPFYGTRGDRYLYPLEDDLGHHPDARMAGVAMLDTGTVGPAVEGVGRAVVDTVEGIAALVMDPVESVAGLARLPAAVRALVEGSPEYWARYQTLPHGEQVRQASRLLTHVVLVCGTAGVGSAKAAATGARLGQLGVPVLSLSGEGALALRMVAVPAGQAVTVVGQGAGALYVLHMASRGAAGGGASPPQGGPGRWELANEHMEAPARRYQAQVTEAPEGYVYSIGEVKFDGFKDGTLLEAKGPNLAKFIDDDLEPLWFFTGGEGMLKQARNQLKAAKGIPVRWVIAEKRLADYLRKLFNSNGLDRIEVLHVPPRP